MLTLFLSAAYIVIAPPRPVHAQDDVTWLLNQINSLRASQGLPGYTLNAQLSAAAAQQSQYLAETCNITHVWPDGASPSRRAAAQGYTGDRVSENIYAGSIARAEDAWNFWMNSQVHYNGLVNTYYNEVGIGTAHGGLCGHAYTLVFGHRGDVAAPPASPSGNPGGAAPVPPTAKPYVPPPPTRTPTATIPTLTPSATWTLTPTRTPTPTFTMPAPTATALVLAAGPTVVAAVPSATFTAAPTATASPSSTPIPPTLTPTPTLAPPPRPVAARSDDSKSTVRRLIPLALVGQIVIIGIAAFVYFRKAR
jgi:hypothetical protein